MRLKGISIHTMMFRAIGLVLGSVVAWSSALADEGMWLLHRPPTKTLQERYDFAPPTAWFEHLQKSCVRFGRGGSASLVSANGLVMTNHHVGSGQLAKLSTPEHNLLETGFYAASRDQERKCEDLEVKILWSVQDVTGRVRGAVTAGMNAAEANDARRKAIATIEKQAGAASDLHYEVVTLYQGAWYYLYGYKRFTDVRLVMAPEQQVAFFGGDNDNFEYPRYDLDMSFFRIYENGKPFRPKHYLRWSTAGASQGDLIFAVGHPYRTQRLFTVDHLKFLRDVQYPTILRRLWRREVQLHTFSARSAENARIARGSLFGVQNSRKAFTGMLAGLLDPAIMQRKIEAEKSLRGAVRNNLKYFSQWGDAWEQVAGAQQISRSLYVRYSALEGRREVIRSRLYGVARHLVRLATEREKPNGQRLEEYRDSALDSLTLQIYSPAPIYPSLEIDGIASGLSYLAETWGGDSSLVTMLLDGRSPRARAEQLVTETKLLDVAQRRRLAQGGLKAIHSSTDPMIRFAANLDPIARELRKQHEQTIESVERQAYARIAAAQFAVRGEEIAPDATGSLRIALGTIQGYQQSGHTVLPFTTMKGMYAHSEERGGKGPFHLPQRWGDRKDKLDLSTPFNFVSTADIIGGNSGSPVVNRAGEVVGLIFDGNIQTLVWNTIFTDKQARAVSVDVRAIIEALRNIYDAHALAKEIVTGGS